MQQNKQEISFLFSEENRMKNVRELNPYELLSDSAIDFLSEVSKEITKSDKFRTYPDVATFAFFCRRSNLMVYKKKHDPAIFRLGRGVVFHVAPSNVPVNFAYSMVAGILSGNINIVRVPSKQFEQIEVICKAINKVAEDPKFSVYLDRLFIVRYDKDSAKTDEFSRICDVRVIWGGDETIAQIRKSVLSARAFDVTFADRYSFAIINADEYVKESLIDKVAEAFYNDTYLFDQNACSAPHLVVWTGNAENIQEAKTVFWDAIQRKIEDYSISPILSVDKLSTLYLHSIESTTIKRVEPINNKLWRVQLSVLTPGVENFRCAGGYFLEYDAVSFNDICKIVNRKYQTLAYYGYTKEKLSQLMKDASFNGIDRVVPIGKTTEFDFVWDGYNLLSTLTRVCFIG